MQAGEREYIVTKLYQIRYFQCRTLSALRR